MRFIKYILAICLLFGSFTLCPAETVSQKEASKIAEQFFNESYGRVMHKPKLVWDGKRLTTNSLFTPFYVYNHPAGGYVVVSAENKAFPILAFDRKGSFNPEHIDEAQKAIMKGYALDIEDIRYDSRTTYEAIEAWNDIRTYIHDIIHAPEDLSDSPVSTREAAERAAEILEEGKDEFFSDIYTPSQWEEIVDAQFTQTRNVKIGVASDRQLTGTVINGRKGNFFRIRTAGETSPFMRLSATEYFTPVMIADLTNPPHLPEIEPIEENPFEFYENFVEQTKREEYEQSAERKLEILHNQPVVYANGGGNFQIKLPENVALARVFNLAGSIVRERYFKDTDTATVDLSGDANGFYVCLIVTESGKPYSFKLYR